MILAASSKFCPAIVQNQRTRTSGGKRAPNLQRCQLRFVGGDAALARSLVFIVFFHFFASLDTSVVTIMHDQQDAPTPPCIVFLAG